MRVEASYLASTLPNTAKEDDSIDSIPTFLGGSGNATPFLTFDWPQAEYVSIKV